MNLTCPNCAAQFVVDPVLIPPEGRLVRCGRCRHEWIATAQAGAATMAQATSTPHYGPQAALPPPSSSSPSSSTTTSAPREDRAADAVRRALASIANEGEEEEEPRRRGWAVAGWLLLIVVVAGLAAAVIGHKEIMARFPEAERVYTLVGLGTVEPGEGLSLGEISSSRTTLNGNPVLIIEGRIANVSTTARAVPPLRASLRDASDREVRSWRLEAPRPRLGPGESAPFRTEIRNLTETEGTLSITFAAR